MKFDKIIKNGTIVTAFGRYPGAIAIKDGKIASILENADGMEADEIIDASGKFVMPGAIDGHLHYQTPVTPEQEDVEHATQACAIGGITTGINMTVRYTDNVEGYHKMQEVFEGEGYVDYAFHGFAKPGNKDDIADLWTKTGVCALKTYTTYANKIDEACMWHIFDTGAKNNGLTMIHAENDSLIKMYEEKLKGEGRKDPMAHVESRPEIVETEMIHRIIYYCEKTNSQVIVVHVSTAEAMEEIMNARQRGVKIWAECCPHYFHFVKEDINDQGPFLAFTPVMRDEANRQKLWELLDKGYVTTIGSDHCPCERATKEAAVNDIWKTHFGLSSLEAFMPVMLNGVNKGLTSLERIVQVTSYNPAKMYGLYPQKGVLQVGADADFIVVDMEMEKAMKEEEVLAKCGWSPYVGITLKGWPVLTMVRGEVVARDGKIVGKKGFGKQISRLAPFNLKSYDL